MPLLTEYASFFVSPFGEKSVTDELNAFLRARRIVNVEKRLIDGERGTGWVFLIEYAAQPGKNAPAPPSNPRIDYREVFSPAEYALFDKLRVLRKDLAEKAGIPVYAVFTNDQLAGMVKKPPASTRDLTAISGIGEARVKQYGEAVIQLFRAENQAARAQNAPEQNASAQSAQAQNAPGQNAPEKEAAPHETPQQLL